MPTVEPQSRNPQWSAAEIGALAHLYRGEMYRSKMWRSRLDATTNWAVVTTGIALSVTFSHVDASPLPIVLVSLLVGVFLLFEARRYRFFDIWRTRVRVMETRFYCPMLLGEGIKTDDHWNEILVDDYSGVYFHISFMEAVGRRLRRNYSSIFAIQLVSYLGKISIHPIPLESLEQLWTRAAIGAVPGYIVLLIGAAYYLGLLTVGLVTLHGQFAVGRAHYRQGKEDRIRNLAASKPVP